MPPSPDSVLDTHTTPQPTSAPLSDPPQSYTYYHAGPLFTLSDLTTNTRLSHAIAKHSANKFKGILPQDLEQRDTSPHSIRDADIKALLSCDLALFTYDGSELDSGTVVEYMVAKFADIPTVILRSDFRGGGDQGEKGEPWNLMSSFWPRSVGVVVNGMVEYKNALSGVVEARTSGMGSKTVVAEVLDVPSRAGEVLLDVTAKRVVEGLEKVLKMPPRLPRELRGSVYSWLALMPGFKAGTDAENLTEMLGLMNNKASKGLC